MKISIVVPCYNARGKIEVCISSLRAIDFPADEFEVIFVDDFSSDGTFHYLENVCREQRNWWVYRLDANSGSPSRPRNLGAMKAKGEYILYLDCDDEIFPDTLREHYNHAVTSKACIVRGYLMVDEGSEKLRPLNRIDKWKEDLSKAAKIEVIISDQSTTVVSLIKRCIIVNNNIKWREDIRMGEDTLFLIEVLSYASNIEYIDHPSFIYNKRAFRSASSTQEYGRRELRNHLDVWRGAETLLAEVGVSYYNIRLHVGLRTVFNAIIFHGRRDIDEDTFCEFSIFLKEVWNIISKSYFNTRHNEIIDTLLREDYSDFIEYCKPRLLVAGFDLKFIKQSVDLLSEHFAIRIDEWAGHDAHDEKRSRELLDWAEYIWCEWLLGNAVWYSHNRKHNQKLVIRMHRMELGRDYGDQLKSDKVHAIVTVSVLFFERLLEKFKAISRDKVRLVPNYATVGQKDTIPEPDRLFNLGAVGIVPRRKGFMRMLKILSELRKKDPRYSLDVFGYGPQHFSWITRDKDEMAYYESCYSFIEENALTDCVNFLGHSKIPGALVERKIGFILSTSDSGDRFPGPESFHLAVLDGFSDGGQGVILRWDGCEYIYPSSMIFDTEEEIVRYIYNTTIEKFYETSEVGRSLMSSKYSQRNFVDSVVAIFRE